MRDFFIGMFDKLIGLLVVLMIVGVVIAAGAMLTNPMGGVLKALGVLIGGGLYVIVVAGMLYLFLGIYHNTKRTAELLESRGG